MGRETTIVTTVHGLQVVRGELPESEHDFSVDLIVTPDEVIGCGPPRRPRGPILGTAECGENCYYAGTGRAGEVGWTEQLEDYSRVLRS